MYVYLQTLVRGGHRPVINQPRDKSAQIITVYQMAHASINFCDTKNWHFTLGLGQNKNSIVNQSLI